MTIKRILAEFLSTKVMNSCLYRPLSADKQLMRILTSETVRQNQSLQLIASENYTSIGVMQANGSIFTNKYAEGLPPKTIDGPSRRYYGGCENIDVLESLCQERALDAYNLDPKVWGVNVQSYSGSTAVFSAISTLLEPGEKLMGLELKSGGHLSHGQFTPSGKTLSNTSKFFNCKTYYTGDDGLIDYVSLEEDATEFCPKMIIVGASAYPRDYDYEKFKQIADKIGAKLFTDMSHTGGLVSAGTLKNPFQFSDLVVTTTHKSLRGPRAALVFYKREYEELVDFSIFPRGQGGAHYNTVAGVAVALKQANTLEFKEYSYQVVKNARVLATELQKFGFKVVTDGTDNHIVLVDLKTKDISGAKFELLAERVMVSVNKNTIFGDKSAQSPSGIRLGTCAMTSRDFKETDFVKVAQILSSVCTLAQEVQSTCGTKKLEEFKRKLDNFSEDILKLKKTVTNFCQDFPIPA